MLTPKSRGNTLVWAHLMHAPPMQSFWVSDMETCRPEQHAGEGERQEWQSTGSHTLNIFLKMQSITKRQYLAIWSKFILWLLERNSPFTSCSRALTNQDDSWIYPVSFSPPPHRVSFSQYQNCMKCTLTRKQDANVVTPFCKDLRVRPITGVTLTPAPDCLSPLPHPIILHLD